MQRIEHMQDIPYTGKQSWKYPLYCHPHACPLEAPASVPGPVHRKIHKLKDNHNHPVCISISRWEPRPNHMQPNFTTVCVQKCLSTLSISSGSSPSLVSRIWALPCLSVSRISEAISRTFCFSKMLAFDPLQDTMVCGTKARRGDHTEQVSFWVGFFVLLVWVLTSPRSRMKQSPLLKLLQDSATSLARTLRFPLTWYNLCTVPEVWDLLNPDSTPPSCGKS